MATAAVVGISAISRTAGVAEACWSTREGGRAPEARHERREQAGCAGAFRRREVLVAGRARHRRVVRGCVRGASPRSPPRRLVRRRCLAGVRRREGVTRQLHHCGFFCPGLHRRADGVAPICRCTGTDGRPRLRGRCRDSGRVVHRAAPLRVRLVDQSAPRRGPRVREAERRVLRAREVVRYRRAHRSRIRGVAAASRACARSRSASSARLRLSPRLSPE